MNMHRQTETAATQPWYLAPSALALIHSLRADPPAVIERVAHYPLTTDHWSEFAADTRIDWLRDIANAAFLAAEAQGGETAARAFLAQPSADDILATIGEHEAAPFLGVNRPASEAVKGAVREALSSFRDTVPGARHPLQSTPAMGVAA